MTQNQKIATYLKQHPNEEISMVTLGTLAGCWAVHSRIADLRRIGMEIEQRTEVHEGKKHSFYRFIQL